MEPDQSAKPDHHPILTASFKEIRSWWSVQCGILGIFLLAGIPALNDQFPNIAPSIVAFFPKHGQQWVPIIGAAIAILTRIVSQPYVIAQVQKMMKGSDGDAGPTS